MNKRIQELLKQANAQYCDLGDASCFKRLGLVEAVVFTPEDLEKFAELIVVECAHLVDTLNEAYGAPSTAGKFIKEHFGVEE